MSGGDHLSELFSRLKTQSSNEPVQNLNLQPSVSSPLFSPPIQTPNPYHSSNIISPVNPSSTMGTPAPEQNRTNNLLNLLKFNNPSSQSSSQAGPMASLQNVGRTPSGPVQLAAGQGGDAAHSRPLSAQDLMASIQGKPSAPAALPSPMTSAGAEKPEAVTSPTGNSKDFLLNLLTKPNTSKRMFAISFHLVFGHDLFWNDRHSFTSRLQLLTQIY